MVTSLSVVGGGRHPASLPCPVGVLEGARPVQPLVGVGPEVVSLGLGRYRVVNIGGPQYRGSQQKLYKIGGL